MDVRHGEASLRQLRGMLDEAERSLGDAFDATRLPARADTDTVDAFLVDAYERAWAQGC
jgi:hypothetical protein